MNLPRPLAVHIEIDTCRWGGQSSARRSFANEFVLIHHAGAHGVTRPTFIRCRFPSSLANCANVN
jgi:hypothetical protein